MVLVVVCLPRPMEGMGSSNFSSSHRTASSTHRTASSIIGNWSRWHILMLKKVYIILSTMVSFLDVKRVILFLQGLLLFVYISMIFLQVHFACVYHHLTDSSDDRRSQCRLI